MRRRLHTILYLAAVLTFPMLCTGCGEEASQQTKDCYRTLRVERQDYTLYRSFAVKLESRKNTRLRPQVSGRLTKIYVKEGARVKKGGPLFVIDQAPYLAAVDAAKAQVSTARAALSTAQLNLEGKQKLYEQQMVGEYDLRRARHAKEEASAQVEAAEAQLVSARTQLGFTTICCPVDGVIGMIPYRVGDLVDPSSGPYLTLASESNYIYAYGALSEEALSELLRDFGCSSLDELPTKLPAVRLYSNWGEKMPVEGDIDATLMPSAEPWNPRMVPPTYVLRSLMPPRYSAAAAMATSRCPTSCTGSSSYPRKPSWISMISTSYIKWWTERLWRQR